MLADGRDSPVLRVKDLSAYDVYRLLGMRSPDTGHSRQHGNKNQFAEHGKYGKSIRIDTKYRYEATNRKTVGGVCVLGELRQEACRVENHGRKTGKITDGRVP